VLPGLDIGESIVAFTEVLTVLRLALGMCRDDLFATDEAALSEDEPRGVKRATPSASAKACFLLAVSS